MKNLLQRAIAIAYAAHQNRIDKDGKPYILHPLYLMSQMPTDTLKIIAVLHDVIEDTNVTLESLRGKGFSEEILEALYILTRKYNQSYMTYIRSVSTNALATQVKFADLEHNTYTTRLGNTLTLEDKDRVAKYRKSEQLLTQLSAGELFVHRKPPFSSKLEGIIQYFKGLNEAFDAGGIKNHSITYDSSAGCILVSVWHDDNSYNFHLQHEDELFNIPLLHTEICKTCNLNGIRPPEDLP